MISRSRVLVRQSEALFALSLRWSTIYALSSGSLPAAIAVVRLSGDKSKFCLHQLTKRKTFEPKKLFFTKIFGKNDDLVDRAMAVFLPGPSTFTGEDTAELFLHGSRAVVDCVSEILSTFEDVRPAKAGEFTKRAFFNSKMSLHDVNALSYLLSAETQNQRILAVRSQEIGTAAESVRGKLVDMLCMLEAGIDFAEDVEFDWDEFIPKVHSLCRELKALQQRVHKGTLISNGIRVAIIGRTNVGKSSLLNRIASREVAIVSPQQGTTRDAVEARVEIASIPVTFIDTAGIRETSDFVEAEGVARTKARALEADMILVVLDSATVTSVEKEVHDLLADCDATKKSHVIVVCNKSDLLKKPQTKVLHWKSAFTSCASSEGIDDLSSLIRNEIHTICQGDGVEALLSRERQRVLLADAISLLEQVHESRDLAIAAQYLRETADLIGEISGAIVNNEILDNIFSSFCIGK